MKDILKLIGYKLYYKSILKKLRGAPFCNVFNIRAKMLGYNIRFRYNAKDKNYTAYTKQEKMFFFHKEQAFHSYYKDIEWRASSLSDVYHLNDIDFKEADVVIDCGANVGDFNLCFRQKKLSIEYIGIEPSPLEYKCLSSNIAPHKAINAALWHSEGNLDFYVSSEHADSSLIQPSKFDTIVTVPTKKLETLFPNKKIKLLKLEAEGAEPEILEGSKKILGNIEYISADLGFERGKSQTSTLAPVTNFLLKNNFEAIKISPSRMVILFKNKAYKDNAISSSSTGSL